MDELQIAGKTVMITPVGCSVTAFNYFNCDAVQAPHGRAPAVATGVKRANPGNIVFTYQGDGDLAAIGMGETIHAAVRSENITIIFINNAIYGMTGGQMAPTTLPNQITQTSPMGRDVKSTGNPVKICELLAQIDGVKYAERTMVDTAVNIRKTKAAVLKAFKNQQNNKGFSIVEILSTCPTNWGLNPIESVKWMQENMAKTYPLGVIKDETGDV